MERSDYIIITNILLTHKKKIRILNYINVFIKVLAEIVFGRVLQVPDDKYLGFGFINVMVRSINLFLKKLSTISTFCVCFLSRTFLNMYHKIQ